MTRVITYGTFDLFHIGHLNLLRRAKELGDHLTVAVSSDEFNRVKNKVCVYPFEERSEIVRAIRFVDAVIREDHWEQKSDDIRRYKIDILVMGSDWVGKFDHFQTAKCRVMYLERTPDISSTEIKASIKGGAGVFLKAA